MGTETAHIRIVDGREVPPPGRWIIDPAHSSIGLVARHMMISKVRGRFREFSGFADIADVPERSLVEVTIQAASIDTDDEERDRHLRSPDFLDVDRFPTITYLSTAVRPTAGDRWVVSGDLTVRGGDQTGDDGRRVRGRRRRSRGRTSERASWRRRRSTATSST